jgi:hypothetical protein
MDPEPDQSFKSTDPLIRIPTKMLRDPEHWFVAVPYWKKSATVPAPAFLDTMIENCNIREMALLAYLSFLLQILAFQLQKNILRSQQVLLLIINSVQRTKRGHKLFVPRNSSTNFVSPLL